MQRTELQTEQRDFASFLLKLLSHREMDCTAKEGQPRLAISDGATYHRAGRADAGTRRGTTTWSEFWTRRRILNGSAKSNLCDVSEAAHLGAGRRNGVLRSKCG